MDIDLSRVGGDDLAVVDESDLDLDVFAAEEVMFSGSRGHYVWVCFGD